MSQINTFINNYKELSKKSKTILIVSTALIFTILIVGIIYFMKDDYSVLFSDLEPQDASAIIRQLDKQKINYIVAGDGKTILVESAIARQARLKVIGAVPELRGGVGFEIFDKDDFGTTEFVQKINYQRALQGELARTIMSLSEVKFARVHLVLPTTSLFKKKEDDSSASVTLVLRNGEILTKKEVSGIQKLVSSSTPELTSSHVTILDQRGDILSMDMSGNQDIIAADKKLQMKREIEQYLIAKAQLILNQILGSAEAHVGIDVTLDFDNLNITREQVITPNGKDTNVTRRKEMKTKNNKKLVDDSSRTTVEVEYELGKEIQHIISTPGTIKKISVAIVVPNKLTQEQHDNIKSLVGNAVGYDKARGDLIALSGSMLILEKPKKAAAHQHVNVVSTNKNSIVMEDAYKNKLLKNAIGNERKIIRYAYDNPLFTLVSIMLFSLVILLSIIKLLMSKKSSHERASGSEITAEEKHQLLLDLKTWLAQE